MPSLGPTLPTIWQGKREVLAGIRKMIIHDDAHGDADIILVDGNCILTKWRYRDKQDQKLMALGCDIFQFSANLIILKDAYRKGCYDL